MAAKCGKVGLSANAWVGWNEETATGYGTVVGPNSATQYALPLSDNLLDTQETNDPPTVTQAFTDSASAYAGLSKVEGPLTFAVPYEGLEHLWLHSFGLITAAPAVSSGTFARYFDQLAGGRFKHATSPSLSFHCARGIVGSGSTLPTVFSYAGCVVDAVKFSCKKGEALTVELSLFGKSVTTATSAVTPVYPTAPIANFTECIATWGAVEIPVTGFDITITKNIDKDRYFLGQTTTCEPPMKKWNVSGSFETEWDNEIRASSSTMRADYIARTQRDLTFAFTSVSKIPGTSAQYFELDLQFPSTMLGQFTPPITQQGRVMITVPFIARDSTIATVPHEFRFYGHTAGNYAE